MEEGLTAGFYLAISALGAGTLVGVFSSMLYSSLWFIRDK